MAFRAFFLRFKKQNLLYEFFFFLAVVVEVVVQGQQIKIGSGIKNLDIQTHTPGEPDI